MPATEQDYQKVQAAQEQARNLTKEATTLQASAGTFADNVMEKVRANRASRGVDALSSAIGTTTGQLASEPAAIRERTADVNPLAVDALTGRQLAQTLSTLTSQARFGEQTQGTVDDWINAGANRILADAAAKEAEARQASQEVADMIAMIQERRAAEQFKLDQALKQRQLGGGGEDRLLTIDEVRELGVPFGTRTSDLIGQMLGSGSALSDLSSKAKTDASGYSALITELSGLENQLKGGGLGSDVQNSQTGPLARFLGIFSGPNDTNAQLRSNIENLKAQARNKLFGAALTQQELESANQIFPSGGTQETENIRRIKSLRTQKENELRNLLLVEGIPENQVESYIQSLKTTESRPPLEQFDISGGGGW